MIYQASFLPPDYSAFSRREPGQRKGETWLSYAVRYNTWLRQKSRPLTAAEKELAVKRHRAWRQSIYNATAQYCRQRIESAKYEVLPSSVFFYFDGTVEHFGINAQYLNRAAVDYLLAYLTKKGGKV